MNKFGDERRLLRLYEIVGCKKRGVTSIVPICPSGWWKLVREKKAPQPVKIGRTTNWYRDEVYSFIDSLRDSRN